MVSCSIPKVSSVLITIVFLSIPCLTVSRPDPESKDERDRVVEEHHHHHHNDTRHAFERLLDARRGSRVSGISELKQYLSRFGYIYGGGGGHATAEFTDTFDSRLEDAIAMYQSKLGLRVTRRLDAPTVSELMSPRCGVSDDATAASGVVMRFAYFPGKPSWSRSLPMTLTYALSPSATIDYVPRNEVRLALRRAFDRWARVIPVTFEEAWDYTTADVKVAFYAGDHGDGEPFDGVLGILAHAFSPESGKLHFDAAERWSVDFMVEASKVAVDLESVATHEIGHVLGLAHSPIKEAVMYPSLSPRSTKVDLTVDDVVGVQALYGSNPDFNLSSLSEEVTSSSDSLSTGRLLPANIYCIGILVVALICGVNLYDLEVGYIK